MAGAKHVACTRDDVARLAKVSSASVSRAYNSPGMLSPERLERIMEAAKALGYVPDRNASGLRRAGSGVILLLMRAPEQGDLSENRVYRWFHSDIFFSALQAAEGSPYRLQPVLWDMKSGLKRLLERTPCDGVVFGIGCYEARMGSLLRKLGVPFAVCSQLEAFKDVNLCYVDEEAGGAFAAELLLKSGRRKLAHISGALESNHVCMARCRGFKERALKGSVEPLTFDGELGIKGGFETCKRLLPSIRKGLVDGVFVVNDLTAVGVMQALLEAGLRIPEDVAMIGYDNLPFIDTLPVRLASLEMPMGRVYGRAVELLVSLMRSPSANALAHEPLRASFVPGSSLPLPSGRC